jgi:hypothetical protein
VERRAFLGAVTGGLLAAPLVASAQGPGKIARVGFLYFGPVETPEEQARRLAGPFLWPTLRELGWVPGQNIVPERRYGQSLAELRTAAAELVQGRCDRGFQRGYGGDRGAGNEDYPHCGCRRLF